MNSRYWSSQNGCAQHERSKDTARSGATIDTWSGCRENVTIHLIDVLGKYFEYLPICPEVGIGMGIPRSPIRLTGDPSSPRAVGVRADDIDVTEKLTDYAHSLMATRPRISGYIFKRGSPSCAMERVKVYNGKGMPGGTSSGLYAGVVMRSLPLMPVEEEGRLNDPGLRESFVERVFVYNRWQRLIPPTGVP